MNLKLRQTLVVLLMTALILPLSFGQTPGASKIVKAIPDDVYMMIHSVHNPERQAIDELWNPVLQAITDAEIHKDILDVFSSIMPPSDQAQFNQVLDTAIPLFEGVDWSSMVKKEFLYASRMAIPIADYMFMMRGEAEKVEKNITGLKAILDTLSALAPEMLVLSEEMIHEMKAFKIDIAGSTPSFNVTIAYKDDLIVASWGGTSLVNDVIAKLAGKSELPSLVDNARFKKSMKSLPKPEDVVTYLDINGIFSPVREFVNEKLKTEVEQAPEGKVAIDIFNKIMNMVDVMDYMGAVEVTEKDRVFSHHAITMKPGYDASPIGKMFSCRKPLDKFERYIPKEALGFSAGSCINFQVLYDLILDIVKNDVPDGANLLLMWQGIQDQINFHPEKDLFGWLGDNYLSVSLPAFKPNPMGGGDAVFMLAVKDQETAKTQLNRGIDTLVAMLKEAQQMIMIKDVAIEGTEGFRSVTHPMMMAMLNPVIGVHDNHLIIGTSPEAIKACLDTAKGEHPSVMENERFLKEGLMAKENLYSISFKDMSGLGQELGSMIQMMSMGVSMASAGMAQEEPEMGKIMIGLGKILGRIGPIVSKIDFYKSSASITTCKDGVTITTDVMNYSLPEKP
ncbi:MAG: hypothetical protein ABIK28_06640 [Planctomycetota bacterium]